MLQEISTLLESSTDTATASEGPPSSPEKKVPTRSSKRSMGCQVTFPQWRTALRTRGSQTVNVKVKAAPMMRSVAVQCQLLTPATTLSSSSNDDDGGDGDDSDYVCSGSTDSSDDSSSDCDEHESRRAGDAEEVDTRVSRLHVDGDPAQERYFLVAESSLASLLSRCSRCSGHATIVVQQKVGSLVVVTATCLEGHCTRWESQPRQGSMPWGNLRAAAAILFSGGGATHTLTLAAHLKMPLFNLRTYNKLQKCYLVPAVIETWRSEQQALLAATADESLVMGGDGRCDSPGFSAKYGSYTVMDLQRNRVLDVQLVQVCRFSSVYFVLVVT